MKSSILFIVFLGLCAFSYSPGQKGLAQVRKVDGLDIYIYSEPVADFEEVFQITGFWNWGEVLDDRATLENVVNTMVRNTKKKNKKAYESGDPKADAIVIYNNDRAIGIRYND